MVEVDAASACPGVFFHCSLIGPEVLPKEQMKTQIKQFLYDQLNEEKGLTACLMIHTFAKDSERVSHNTFARFILRRKTGHTLHTVCVLWGVSGLL